MTAKKNQEQDTAVIRNVVGAVELASNVAADARRQLARYRKTVVDAADKIQKASDDSRRPTDDEKALMTASAKAASSLADVMIDLADAAFEQMSQESAATRDKAIGLVRKVVKLAVDDALDGAFEGPPRAASPTATSVELVADDSWQRIYLPGTQASARIYLTLEGALKAPIQVRAGRKPVRELRRRGRVSFTLTGSHPSLSVRVSPGSDVKDPAVALLHITGAHKHSIALAVRPRPKRRRRE